MGILRFFTKAKPPLPRIDHPVFGPMEATLANDDGSYFWETPDPSLTPKGSISVFLDADAQGPSEAQVALWKWIYDNSEHLAKCAEPLLLDRLKGLNLEARIGDLCWTAVGLPLNGDREGQWDMSFQLPVKHSAILTAYFKNGVPTVVSFDD